MSPLRPDIVDTWVFRFAGADHQGRGLAAQALPAQGLAARGLEILLLRRSPGRILPGLWQCVSGSLEPGERVAHGALRELAEETGIASDGIEAFYDLDLVNQFHEPSVDAVLLSAVFAVRVGRGVEPVLSHEHDALMWLGLDAALEAAVWPGYREAIRRIGENLVDPARAAWFELDLDGRRRPRT